MSNGEIAFLAVVVAAFVMFGCAVFWADRRTN